MFYFIIKLHRVWIWVKWWNCCCQLPRKWVGLEVGLLFDQIETYLTAMVAVTPSIDLLRDDLVDTLGQPVMNLQNILPTAPIAPTSANQWKDQPNVIEQFNFMGVPCLKVNMDSKKPIYFFKLLVTDKLINTVVLETNKHVEQEINKDTYSKGVLVWKIGKQ